MHIRISLSIKFHFEQTILNFWTKFTQEKYLYSETENVKIIIEFHIFKLALVPNFRLNWQFWFFLTRFTQKGFFNIFYIIQHIQISLVRNVSSDLQFWFFESDWPKKIFPVENKKRWTSLCYGILHIWISLDTKFKLKLIILSFWTKFAQKRFFQSKTKQAVQGLQAFFCSKG